MPGLLSKERMWTRPELAKTYDAVIIGAGVHGLATAHYLAELGVRKIAVLEKGYLGSGNSGRNTAIVRSNYRTAEAVPFYDESVKLYERLSSEVGFNILFSQQGHLTLGHSEAAVTGLRIRAELNRALGINSQIIWPKEIKELVPDIDISGHVRYPIQAALYHPPGGIIRHDAVVWGYARAASRRGVHIHPRTEAVGIGRENGRIVSVTTNRGAISTGIVVNAASAWASLVSNMVDVDLPIICHPLQACVTESLKPFLNKVIVSGTLHVYVNQTPRGEVVLGGEIDPYQTYNLSSTFPTLKTIAGHTLELFPRLKHARILRQWTGICDMTPDYSPIISGVPQLKGYYLDVGWGTYGFKAAPAAGKNLAKLIVSGETPPNIRSFNYTRFHENRLGGEKAAASVSS